MADDVVVQNLYNFICISGGFVELPVLLKNDSPLGSRISELDAKNSLTTQAGRPFVAVKDCYGDGITGVRIDLRKKICQQYIGKGSCRRAQGKCKFWHICKSFIEGNCAGKCNLSHNFFDEHNKTKAEELALEKFSNETIKNVVAWSLPQVCQLYLKNECKSDECLYLHVCATAVQGLEGGSPCHCPLSHSLIDSHNKKILKQYDLVPHLSMKVEFVRCSILVPKEQSVFDKSKCSREASATGGKVTNTPSSSKHGEYESSFQVKTGMDKKCRKRKPLQDKASEQEPICRPVGTINPVNKDSLEFLNTETGEKGNCMDPCSDEYKSANFSFKDVRHVKEGDLNAAKKGQKKPKMTAQSRDGAVKSQSAELDKDQEGSRTCNESHQRSLDCANAVKVSTKESKMITAQTSDGAVKSSEVMKVEKEQCGCLTRKDFQKKRLEDSNAVNRCRPKSKMATAQSSDDAVKRNAKEVVEDKEVYQTRIESQQKRLQNGNVARSPQESKTTTKKLVGTANAKVKEGKKDQESGETRNASQQKRFQGENIVKKSSQESTMATTVANGQGGALTNTEFQQKILYDSNAVKSTRQKSKMTTAQSSDGAVKRNAKEVVKDKEDGQTRIESQQKILDSAVKVTGAEKAERDQYAGLTRNGSHQRSLDCANAVKVSTKESKMITAQTSDGAVKSSEVMKVEKEQCGCLTRKDFQKKRLEDSNAVNRCRPKSKMATAQSSDDAVKRNAKEVVEDKEVYQTRIESQQKRLQNGNVARSPQESKTTTKKLVGTANAKVKEGKKDQESGETRNASQQKRFQGENIVKKSSQESTMATTVANGQGGALTNTEFQQKILYDSNAVKSTRQKSKMTTAQSSDGAVKRNAKEVVKDKEDGQTRIESQQKILDSAVKVTGAEKAERDQYAGLTRNGSHQRSLDCANAVKVSTKESKMITAQTSDGAVKSSEVMKVEKEQCGCLTRKDFQKKRLEDSNAVNRCRPKSKMATAQSSDDAVKRNAKEVVEDKEVYQTRIESQQKRLQNGNVARSPQESKTTTKKLVGTANAKVKEGKKDQESGETRNASQQKRFQGENIVKKSSQESTMATTVANGQGGALTNTEFQQKILYDSNAVKSTRQKSKMTTAQSSDGAVKRNAKEVVKDKEDGQTRIESQQKILDSAVKVTGAEKAERDQYAGLTRNGSHQRSLDCANAVKVSTKESKMITAQTSDGAVKSSEVMKVEKEQCGCLTRKDFQKKRLEDSNAVNRCRPKSKMATAQSSDDAVKRNAKEVVEDKEVYQTRIESQQKRLQNGNVARSPQESKTTTKKLVGTANAKVKEGKKDQESGETRNASQQKRFQGENIVKKSSQESTMATTVANGQGGALTDTEFQQKILYDSNAVKSTRQKSKMTTAQSSDGAVKRNAKEVVKDKEDGQTRIESQQKILDSAVKVTGAEKAERDQYAGLTRNGLQQGSIHEANAVKRSWQKSNVTTSQSSDCAVKAKVMGVKKDGGSGNTCNGLQQRNLFDANAVKRSPQLQECNMTATQSSGDAVKANVREVQNDDGSGQACKESQERSLDQRHVVVQSSQQSITTTEKLSEAAKAKFKVVEEDEGIGQTRNKSHHRLDYANAVKKGRQGCKMSITEGLDSTVKGAVREVKKDQDYSQIRNESQQESLDHGHVMERISQESLTTTENLSEATKPKVKVKTKGREGGQSRKTSVQKSLGGTNSAKRHQQESRTNNNQSSDEAVKAKVKEVKKDERGDQTRRESRQKSLDDRNAVERGSHGFMTNAKTLSGAAKAKNVEEKRDQEGGNKSEHKSLDGTNALKRGRQETMSTTTLSSDELVKAKVKEVKRDREGSQIRIESQPKSLGGAHTMKNSRQKSVTTTQLSSDGAEKVHEGGQTRNESQQGIFDDEHAAMRSRQESKITTKSLTGAMKAKVKEGEKDHERSQIHNEIQQKGLDDVDAVQRSQLESKTTTKKLGGYFKATVEEVGIDSGVVPTHNEPLEKLLQDKNAGKRRRKKSKMTAQGFVTSIKEMQKCTEAYQTCSETKRKSLEASRDPKDVNTASETHVTGGQSDNPTMRAPGSELPSGLLTVDSSREFFNTSSSTLPASQEVYVDTQQNEPISSSCSSVQDPKKCTPSKKAVFECILKEYNGSVSFDAISKRQDLFPDGCGDIVSWFEARNDRFFLRKKEGTILEVSVFCRGAKLCFNQMCSKKDCQYFHVCKEYIAGFCRFGCGCQRNHSFQYDEDRKFISKRKLGGLTHEELRKVLKLSMPQVCFDYNEGCCTRGLSCNKIHICEDFTTSRCEGEEHCGLQHENAFVTLHTTAILRNYGLKLKDDNVNLVRKMLLFCEDIPSGYRNRPSSKIVACKDLSISSKGASAATSFEPSAVEVFECLCKEYNCSASLSVISKRTDLFPSAFDDIESWFRKKKDRFRITEDQQGEILQVHAFSTKARVCLGYNAYYGECKREKCPYLHVCRKYITNSSSNGASCPRNHHFQDEREKSLLSKFKFDQLTDEQLRRLVLSSTPRVCEDYNNGMCGRGDSCDKIHICSDHMTKCHREGCGCYLDHESAMATEHTRAILKRYLQDHLTSDILKKIILVCDQPPKRKEAGKPTLARM